MYNENEIRHTLKHKRHFHKRFELFIRTRIEFRNQKQIESVECKFRTHEYSFSNVCGSSGVAGLSEPALGPDLQ